MPKRLDLPRNLLPNNPVSCLSGSAKGLCRCYVGSLARGECSVVVGAQFLIVPFRSGWYQVIVSRDVKLLNHQFPFRPMTRPVDASRASVTVLCRVNCVLHANSPTEGCKMATVQIMEWPDDAVSKANHLGKIQIPGGPKHAPQKNARAGLCSQLQVGRL